MIFQFVPSSLIEVPEIPFKEEEVDLEASKTALIIVDMQNDFVRPKGQLVIPAAAATIPHIRKLLKTARNLGMRVAFTQDTHVDGDLEWEIWPEHCREGSWGWEIIDELKPRSGELVCPKNRYDGYGGCVSGCRHHYPARLRKSGGRINHSRLHSGGHRYWH